MLKTQQLLQEPEQDKAQQVAGRRAYIQAEEAEKGKSDCLHQVKLLPTLLLRSKLQTLGSSKNEVALPLLLGTEELLGVIGQACKN